MTVLTSSLRLHLMRGALALLVIVAFLMIGGSQLADAQQVDCEQVSYNDRIVTVCTTIPSTEPSATTVPIVTPEPTPTSTPEPEPATTPEATATPEPEPTPTDVSEDAAQDSSEPDPTPSPVPEGTDTDSATDRGDRGGRSGGDDESEQDGAPSSDDAETGQVDETELADDDLVEDVASVPDASEDSGASATGDTTPDQPAANDAPIDYEFDTTPERERGSLPLIAGLVGLTTIGAFFFVAARRARQH